MANGVAAVSLGTFDIHRFIKRLIAAGLPEASAETFADEQARLIEQMSEKVDQATAKAASKEELRTPGYPLKADFKRAEARVDSKFDLLRKDIAAMENRLDAKFEAQRKDNEIMKRDIIIRITGVVISVAGLLFAAIKLF